MSAQHTSILNILSVSLVILFVLSFFFEVPRAYVEEHLGVSKAMVGVTYIFIVVVTTVFAPLAGLPLSPAVSVIIGPFLTAIYSILGWSIGASLAFFIARYLARPILCRLVNMTRVERYESYIPERHMFWWLILLRIIMPVDVLSYAIGLTKRVGFPLYAVTTFIGIIPFSFIWAYGGYSLLEQNYVTLSFVLISGALLFFLSLMYYYIKRINK